jgi:hypothetical protein
MLSFQVPLSGEAGCANEPIVQAVTMANARPRVDVVRCEDIAMLLYW